MPLNECMRLHTTRQLMIWTAWLDQQWNKPDVTCHYLAQIAMEVRTVLSAFAKKPPRISLDQFLIEFTTKAPESDEPMSIEEAAALAKARWGAALGISIPGAAVPGGEQKLGGAG